MDKPGAETWAGPIKGRHARVEVRIRPFPVRQASHHQGEGARKVARTVRAGAPAAMVKDKDRER